VSERSEVWGVRCDHRDHELVETEGLGGFDPVEVYRCLTAGCGAISRVRLRHEAEDCGFASEGPGRRGGSMSMLSYLDLGFTGTQRGMTTDQLVVVRGIVRQYVETAAYDVAVRIHHGVCVGADEEMDGIARDEGAFLVMHPADGPEASGADRAPDGRRPLAPS
jgi:hypothetical protein